MGICSVNRDTAANIAIAVKYAKIIPVSANLVIPSDEATEAFISCRPYDPPKDPSAAPAAAGAIAPASAATAGAGAKRPRETEDGAAGNAWTNRTQDASAAFYANQAFPGKYWENVLVD